MPLSRISFQIGLALMAAAVGCRCSSPRCIPSPQVAPCAYEPTLRQTDSPDLTAGFSDPPEPFFSPYELPSPGDSYRALDEKVCQCTAATNARVSHLLRLETHWANAVIECEEGPTEKAVCLTRDLLKLQEAKARNDAAGAALSAFFALAALEIQADYLQRGIQEVELTLTRFDQLRDKGLNLPEGVHRADLAVRLHGLLDKSHQLVSMRIELNGQLMRLLGCPLDETALFLPQVDWTPDMRSLDIEELTIDALARRSDVRSIRLTICRLERATLPVARSVLKAADAALGTVELPPGCLHRLRCSSAGELEPSVRCRQLRVLLKEVEQLSIAKTKSAAYKVLVQQRRVALARDAVLERRSELTSLEKRRDVDSIGAFEISVSRGRLFEAEAHLIQQVAELKLADVALRQVTGVLAVECGYEAKIYCEPGVARPAALCLSQPCSLGEG